MQHGDERRFEESYSIASGNTDSPRSTLGLSELVLQMLEGSREGADRYAEVLQHCRRQGIGERRLWHGLAVYRQTGSLECPELPWADLMLSSRQKLHRRIAGLIGELPPESLQEFRALVALSATVAERTQFVCDLVVYLYTEREKGRRWAGSDGRLYGEFFAGKLMWELEVMRQLAERYPLEQLAEEFGAWLSDRILDGEVLI
jgi:hypothetical protein